MSYTRLNPKPIVKKLDLGTVTLAADGYAYKSAAAETVSGYTPVGTLGAEWTHPGTVAVTLFFNGTSVFAHLKNDDKNTAQTETRLYAYVLYLPNNVT